MPKNDEVQVNHWHYTVIYKSGKMSLTMHLDKRRKESYSNIWNGRHGYILIR